MLHQLIDLFLHLDTHLASVISAHGAWTYALLFLIIFCETGLVVTPFLPGDSLLFAAGAFAATGSFNLLFLWLFLVVAAVIGDSLNYRIGRHVGPKIFFVAPESKAWYHLFLKKSHLDMARNFYDRHGKKTIILARFVPIVRTFAPFLAGIGQMSYREFFLYNVVGGVSWISLFLFGGYLFGNIPAVKHNFSLVILAIIIVSLVPGVVEYVRQRKNSV